MRIRLGLSIAAVLTMLTAFASPWAQEGQKEKAETKKQKLEQRQEKATGLPAVMWRDPGAPATLDLSYGAGGRDHAPNANDTFTFVNEDTNGTSAKFDVKDSRGNVWRVKLGEESKPETAATRLVWAAGYFVDEDYYLEQIKVTGLPKLKRGEKYVGENGVVRGAQLELKPKSVKRIGNWHWADNPFQNTKEFYGLRIMMVLVNDWDLSTVNNAIYAADGEQRFLVSDLGATFGNTGNVIARSKSNLEDFAKSQFIDKVKPDTVDFVMHSRPFPLTVVDPHYYQGRAEWADIAKDIPRSAARWLGMRLGQLSEKQIRDCFRASGYSPQEVEGFTKVIQERIAMLNSL